MEADARYTYVGAAVLLLVGALVGALIWLQGVGGRGEFNRFAIHFEGQALDGLEVGAEVNLRGIRVGRVEDYGLSGDRINRVRVVEHVGVVYETHDTIWIAKANNPRTLDDFDVPVFQRFGSELCKFDRITMVDRFSGFFAGVLFLDDFVPYKKVDEDTAQG